ncbi:MAG: vanadium-dependent haloperoxidase [Vulcanimicrobiota bacterium]
MDRFLLLGLLLGLLTPVGAAPASPFQKHSPGRIDKSRVSAAYLWLDTILEVSARDVERFGARPTILSRQMAIPLTAAYDAWALYDERARPTRLDPTLRRPSLERTQANKERAIAYATYRTLLDQFPSSSDYIRSQMVERGFDPDDADLDPATPVGIGNRAALAVLDYRHHDGANQLGDELGSNGKPYSDYTMYRPVNPTDRILDPDCWQPLPFSDGKGGYFYPGFLTPHWYRVRPLALERADQFRPGPPPRVGSDELKREVDECIHMNANLTVEEKALVEFMRDGPRSTAQSGHWLRFAQDVSRRDHHNLDQDVKLFFCVGNTAMDAFIASWDAKRYYDSSRPWTLIRHYYKGQQIRGWAGPGQGVKEIPAEEWHPYSPATFVTPPFPGYTSGHSTVSGACAEMLKLFTGSDRYQFVAERTAGSLTEEGFTCAQIQQTDAQAAADDLSCEVALRMPTFSKTAEMAGISRVLGGYHIQADNRAGLELGRQVARYSWTKYQAYFEGR